MTAVARYWAGLRAAAGTAEEPVTGATVAQALTQVRARHDDRFAQVLAVCALVVDGEPVGSRDHDAVPLADGAVLDCLPPFAGG